MNANPLIDIAELVVKSRYEDLPADAVARAKVFILDTLGVGIAGSTGPAIGALTEVARSWGAGDDATVWGSGVRLPAGSAAVVNGYQIHALEFDCVHEPAVVHPMATLFSAVLAHAERRSARGRPVSGRDLILAVALGVETAAVIGASAKSVMRFFRPATAGGFGVVAAIGKLEGLDVATLLNAWGILYGQTSGTMQAHVEGSMMLGLQVGFNARAGLSAVDLAQAGFTGPKENLTGMYGYYKLIEPESDLAPWWAKLGREWQVRQLAHKPFPSGRLTHAAVDALRRARAEADFVFDEIESVECWLPPLAHRLCGRPNIPAPHANYAKLCVPFVFGVEAVHRQVVPQSFWGDALVDANVHAVAGRVKVHLDDNPDPNALWPQRFRMTLKGGRVADKVIEHAIGHPLNPLSHEEHLAKFRMCYALKSADVSAGTAMITAVDTLDVLADAAWLGRAAGLA
ncbi:MAG: MmgE/PrpD family protein [Burkholderiales bacterium]|nr:MmgE/PrpD family protein [Burkholderiales bacterium]